jgi:hypothetical protein
MPDSPSVRDFRTDPLIPAFAELRNEVALLSGRVELSMRLLARLVAKIDPGYLDDPHDPDVRRRSDLLGKTVIEKLKHEALAQAAHDPEQFDRLRRYFKDIPR